MFLFRSKNKILEPLKRQKIDETLCYFCNVHIVYLHDFSYVGHRINYGVVIVDLHFSLC